MVDILDLVVDTLEKNAVVSENILLDELPTNGGLYAELGPSYNEALYYNKGSIRLVPVIFLAKSIDQAWCVRELSRIGDYFQSKKKYPQKAGCRWLDATISSGPSKVGRQEDGQFIYTSTVNMKFYFE